MTEQAVQPMLFVANPSLRRRAALLLAGALGLFALATGGFALALATDAGVVALQGMTTLPVLIGLGLLGAALAARRTPLQVVVDARNVTVTYRNRVLTLPWDQIAWVEEGTTTLGFRGQLRLLSADGQSLATIGEDIFGYGVLTNLLKHHLSQRANPATDLVKKKRSRRNGWSLVFGGVFALGLAGANAFIAYTNSQNRALLASQGVEGTATVVRKFIAPDGRTHRIEYRVDVPGAPLANVEIEPMLWVLIQQDQKLTVKHVPGRPDLSRLLSGQIDDNEPNPRLMLIVGVGVTLLGVVFLVAGVLALLGIELGSGKKPGPPPPPLDRPTA